MWGLGLSCEKHKWFGERMNRTGANRARIVSDQPRCNHHFQQRSNGQLNPVSLSERFEIMKYPTLSAGYCEMRCNLGSPASTNSLARQSKGQHACYILAFGTAPWESLRKTGRRAPLPPIATINSDPMDSKKGSYLRLIDLRITQL